MIELEDAQRRWEETSQAGSLKSIAQRLDQRFCDIFDEFVRTLERAEPIPELPDMQGMLQCLQDEFDKLQDNAVDAEPSTAEAGEILAMTGQYTALRNTIAECRNNLGNIDWKTLNQNYFY